MPRAGQSPEAEGSDIRSAAAQIEGLLDDDGHYNPNPNQLSRGHPDYNADDDQRAQTPQRDRHGRFTRSATPEPAQEREQQAVDEAEVEQPADEPIDDDTEQVAGDTEVDQTQSADEQPATDTEETSAIETLSELAEALELPIEELTQQLTHTFRAADEDVTVTLEELTKGYQKDADYRRSTGKLAEERRQLEAQHTARMTAFEQENALMAQQLNAVEGLFLQQLESPELNANSDLRKRDPAEWTARREEIGNTIGQLRQARQMAAQRYQQFQQNALLEMRDREMTALTDRLPEFGEKERTATRDAITSLGYTPDEISNIFDHRLILGALELSALRAEVKQLRDEKAKAKDTVKRVKKDIPKITKPGKQRLQTKKGIDAERIARLKQRAAKSGTVEDAAAYIETLL